MVFPPHSDSNLCSSASHSTPLSVGHMTRPWVPGKPLWEMNSRNEEDTPRWCLSPQLQSTSALQLQNEWLTLSLSLGDATCLPRSPSLQGSWFPPKQLVLRSIASTILEFTGGAARGLARSTPNLFSCWSHPPSWSMSAAGGVGTLGIVKGEEELATQAQSPQICSRIGFRCGVKIGQLGLTRPTLTGPTECGLGKLGIAQGSDE